MLDSLSGQLFKVTEVGYPQDDGSSKFIVFSQFMSRQDVGQEPIISTSINTAKPCYGPFHDNLVLNKTIVLPFDKE